MRNFTRYSAFFLLLLFARVLVPDSLITALHAHTHTEEKAVPADNTSKQQLATKHSHCHTDQVFGNLFYQLPNIFISAPQFAITSYQNKYYAVWKFTFPNAVCLRGPPAFIYSLLA